MESYEERVRNFREKWPEIEFIDLIFTDINATPRGKRVPVDALNKVGKGMYLPISTISLNTAGSVVEEAGLGEALGEPDNICFPIPESLLPTTNPKVGQMMLTMMDENGSKPTSLDIRNVLVEQLQQLHSRNIYPVVALELEFYLVDKKRTSDGMAQPAINPFRNEREKDVAVYDIDSLDDYSDFLIDLNHAAKEQKLNTIGALAESAPGQFEINFRHQKDVANACDQVVQAKRLIRQVAHQHDFDVTFMAKPFVGEAGNGMHIHLSVVDEKDQNLFSLSEDKASPFFYKTIASMLYAIPGTMALLCPSVNSYRRFLPGAYVPLKADWGQNHRGVALRIPQSDGNNRRIEHRIAGADVNPYILASVVLDGVIASDKFTEDQCPPPLHEDAMDIPRRMSEALDELRRSEPLTSIPKEFIDVYHACKETELNDFEREVTPLEVEWMLHSA